jgi:hypothetical protein
LDEITESNQVLPGGGNLASFFFNEILSEESEENEDPFDMLTRDIKVG